MQAYVAASGLLHQFASTSSGQGPLSTKLYAFLQVKTAYAAVSALNRELLELQQSNADFGAALEAVGTRGELAEVKRRLEAHQALLSQWEEKVAQQLEFISELQSPTKRNSLMAAATRVSFAGSARGSFAGMGRISAALGSSVGGSAMGQPGWQASRNDTAAGAAASLRESSFVGDSGPAAMAPTASRGSSAFGSSFSYVAGGLTGAASAPNSPAMWDTSSPGGAGSALGGVSRRSAFTPGPALTGMGDTTPGGNTPR